MVSEIGKELLPPVFCALDMYLFETISAVQGIATERRWIYNHDRLNEGLGGITPAEKLKLAA